MALVWHWCLWALLLACYGVPVVRVCITVVGLGRAVSCAPGSAVIVVIYAWVITCGQSFTVLSGWGILISFWSVLVFFLPSSPFYYYYLIIIIIIVVIIIGYYSTVIIISTELLALCDGCLGWGWVWRVGLMAGLWVGRAFGCSCYLGLGSAAPAPSFLGTQPPYICDAGVKQGKIYKSISGCKGLTQP